MQLGYMRRIYYDQLAAGYDELYGDEQLQKQNLIQHTLLSFLSANSTILDVGCGTGISLAHNAFGIDPSFQLLLRAKKKSHYLIHGVGEALPFKDTSFDVVQCVTALHNFTDWKKGIGEMKRVSKQLIVLSLLKKADAFHEMRKMIEQHLCVVETKDAHQDIIFFCRKK